MARLKNVFEIVTEFEYLEIVEKSINRIQELSDVYNKM